MQMKNLNLLDGYNTRLEAVKDRIGELCNSSEEIILRTIQRNKNKEDWKQKILREDRTYMFNWSSRIGDNGKE